MHKKLNFEDGQMNIIIILYKVIDKNEIFALHSYQWSKNFIKKHK